MKSVDSQYIKEIVFQDADSLLRSINYGGELYNELSSAFVFRGHSSERFKLIPTALRIGAMDGLFTIHPAVAQMEIARIWFEFDLLLQFYDECDRYNLKVPDCPRLRNSVVKRYDLDSLFEREDWLPKDLWEVAALAQHYGLPTRLLDWSSNINTALYFAIVGCVNPCNKRSRLDPPNGSQTKGERCEIWALDTRIVIAKEKNFPLKIIRPAYFGNPNLAAQEGIFTLWTISKPVQNDKSFAFDLVSTNDTPLDCLLIKKLDELKADVHPYLYRLSFPQSDAVVIHNYLLKKGHTAAKLFPGYGGIVQSIEEKARFCDHN